MHPVLRSIMTSFTTPISSPCEDFTLVPTSLLTWTVVVWVWADTEAIAAPRTASITPNSGDVFISDRDQAQTEGAVTNQSPPPIAADVKRSSGAMKMRSLVNSDVDLALPRCLPAVSALRSCARKRRSG
jgi:hypothetical protein